MKIKIINKNMDFETIYDDAWKKNESQILAKHHYLALGLFDGGTILDFGCSDGLFLKLIKEKSGIGRGVDISPFIVKKAKENGLDVEFGDVTKPLNFPNNSFDYVSALNILEHLFEPELFISEMRRVSRKYIIITTPNFASLPTRLQVLKGKVPENNTPRKHHVVWVTWKVLNEMLKRNNLKLIKASNNTFWEEKPLIGLITKQLVKIWPSLFALSFTVKAEKFKI